MSWGSYYFRTASQLHTILRCLVDVPVLNYPTYDNELHALHQEVKHWRVYLLGKEVVVRSDHKHLQYLTTQSKLQQA
ncbi:hypothetical protein ACFX13_020317 [Malus domestica]